MTRLFDLRDRTRKKWQDKKIKKFVEKNMDKATDCIPIKSDDVHYEISCYDGASQNLDPEDFVNPCYSMAVFIEVYKHAILPVNGPKLWEKTGMIPPLPPNFRRGVGRPPRAKRQEKGHPSHCNRMYFLNLHIKGSQSMLHKFTQCSTEQLANLREVVPSKKGGKMFVTMTNLSAAVAAVKKKKKVVKKK
ncbi:hypothetical protein Sango_2421900 [Sesamum angolense]|uniref:Uncharacterized protein n=1 Tax=Sesamum angolense TaxID=2727404 RepID=A0AAE1W7J7_9LAMI|nr:hypothetical protein Sango_2421900 [Sesamum angolense]